MLKSKIATAAYNAGHKVTLAPLLCPYCAKEVGAADAELHDLCRSRARAEGAPLRERQTQRIPALGVDREDYSDADPIAFDAAQAAEGIQPPHSGMFRLSVKQREWFEDLVARAGP